MNASLRFEHVMVNINNDVKRTRLGDGWLLIFDYSIPVFVPDPQHLWNGESTENSLADHEGSVSHEGA